MEARKDFFNSRQLFGNKFDPEPPDDGLDEVPLKIRRIICEQAERKLVRPFPSTSQGAR